MGRECWLGSKDTPPPKAGHLEQVRGAGGNRVVNIASFPPSTLPMMLSAQETLRIRVRGLGSQLEGEKGARISDPTPDRHPARLSHSPQGVYLEPH